MFDKALIFSVPYPENVLLLNDHTAQKQNTHFLTGINLAVWLQFFVYVSLYRAFRASNAGTKRTKRQLLVALASVGCYNGIAANNCFGTIIQFGHAEFGCKLDAHSRQGA